MLNKTWLRNVFTTLISSESDSSSQQFATYATFDALH